MRKTLKVGTCALVVAAALLASGTGAGAWPLVGKPAATPAGWQERTILATPPVGVTVGPIDVATLVVDGRPNATDWRRYDIAVWMEQPAATCVPLSAGACLPPAVIVPAVSVFTGGRAPAIHEETPIAVAAQQVFATPSIRMRYDESQETCLAGTPTTCMVDVPLDLMSPEWAAGDGLDAELIIQVDLQVNGRFEQHWLRIPLAGQIASAVL